MPSDAPSNHGVKWINFPLRYKSTTYAGIRVISFRKANKREVKSYEQKSLN